VLEAIQSRADQRIIPEPDVAWLEQVRVTCVERRREACQDLLRLADGFYSCTPVHFDGEHFKSLRDRRHPNFAPVVAEVLSDEVAEQDFIRLIQDRRSERMRQERLRVYGFDVPLSPEEKEEDVPFEDSPLPAVRASSLDDALSVWERAKVLGSEAEENIKRVKGGAAPKTMRVHPPVEGRSAVRPSRLTRPARCNALQEQVRAGLSEMLQSGIQLALDFSDTDVGLRQEALLQAAFARIDEFDEFCADKHTMCVRPQREVGRRQFFAYLEHVRLQVCDLRDDYRKADDALLASLKESLVSFGVTWPGFVQAMGPDYEKYEKEVAGWKYVDRGKLHISLR
jgi:hypothetical protein